MKQNEPEMKRVMRVEKKHRSEVVKELCSTENGAPLLTKIKNCYDETAAQSDELNEESEEAYNDRLRDSFGNCYRLIEALKKETLPCHPYLSAIFTEEAVLKKMPKTYLIVS